MLLRPWRRAYLCCALATLLLCGCKLAAHYRQPFYKGDICEADNVIGLEEARLLWLRPVPLDLWFTSS